MHEYDTVIGVDVGGTKIEVALIRFLSGNQFEIKKKIRRSTERDQGPDHIIGIIADLCKEVCQEMANNLKAVAGIGLGLPGTVDPLSQIMIKGNTSALIGIDVSKALKKKLNYDGVVNCANDANCFALAETLFGAGVAHGKLINKGPKELVGLGITLGTGVGGGLIINGKIFEGAGGGALEIGHSFLRPSQTTCYCQCEGHAEQFLSGTALENFYYQKTSTKKLAKDIFNEGPIDLILQYKNDLSHFIANLCNLYDPHFVVLGGGVSLQKNIYENLLSDINKKRFYFNHSFRAYQHVLGDSAGVIGAALLS